MPIKNYLNKSSRLPEFNRHELDGPSRKSLSDEVDRPPSSYHISNWDIAFLCYSIIIHVVDVGFDINVAYTYYAVGKRTYFILTVCYMVIPALVVTTISLRMYFMDKNPSSVSRMTIQKRFIWFLLLLFQLAPVLRYYDSLVYALKSRKAEREHDNEMKKHYYRKMLNEDADVALLRVFECYLETAPQQILQITMLLIDSDVGKTLYVLEQCGSIFSSFLSMAWSMASYQRAIRFDQDNKNNISWVGTLFQVLWHLLVTVSRILALAVVASLFPYWAALGIGVHWVAMTAWLAIIDQTAFFSQSRPIQFIFDAMVGLVYIFNFISIREGRTRSSYLIFYCLSFCENVACVLIWAFLTTDKQRRAWFFYPLVVIPLVSFLLAMLSLISYYRFFHPKKYVDGFNSRNVD